MKTARAARADVSRYLSSGPLVWAATIFCSTLLLVLLKQALWFVVPFLLAIILYYALFPAVRRLTLAGVDRETSAALVAGIFFVVTALAVVAMLPVLAAQAVSGEEAVTRYLAGGQVLVDRTLSMLESQFGFLKRVEFHAEMGKKIAAFSGSYAQDHLTDALLSAAVSLPALLLAPFLAFFFLRDGRRFLKFCCDAVPNAYYERTLYMVDRVDATARAYFQGLLKLTFLDTICLGLGLWVIGLPNPLLLGLMAAVLAWVPFVGLGDRLRDRRARRRHRFSRGPLGRLCRHYAVPGRPPPRRFRVHAAHGRPQPAHASPAHRRPDLRRRSGRGDHGSDPGATPRRRGHGDRRDHRGHRQRSPLAGTQPFREVIARAAHYR